jgi:hypothetical protein
MSLAWRKSITIEATLKERTDRPVWRVARIPFVVVRSCYRG